ncbi:hypothetical protein JHW43_004501 [Diplocarpon mali]|nr:hypothetical protein JHW43_004501 [Diplocarpon mali]
MLELLGRLSEAEYSILSDFYKRALHQVRFATTALLQEINDGQTDLLTASPSPTQATLVETFRAGTDRALHSQSKTLAKHRLAKERDSAMKHQYPYNPECPSYARERKRVEYVNGSTPESTIDQRADGRYEIGWNIDTTKQKPKPSRNVQSTSPLNGDKLRRIEFPSSPKLHYEAEVASSGVRIARRNTDLHIPALLGGNSQSRLPQKLVQEPMAKLRQPVFEIMENLNSHSLLQQQPAFNHVFLKTPESGSSLSQTHPTPPESSRLDSSGVKKILDRPHAALTSLWKIVLVLHWRFEAPRQGMWDTVRRSEMDEDEDEFPVEEPKRPSEETTLRCRVRRWGLGWGLELMLLYEDVFCKVIFKEGDGLALWEVSGSSLESDCVLARQRVESPGSGDL